MDSMHFSFIRFRSSSRSLDGASSNIQTIWHIYLMSLMGLLCGVGIFSYLTYTWITTDDVVSAPLVASRDAQTIIDLHKVIETYNARSATYEELRLHQPIAPSYAQGVGVPVVGVATQDDSLVVDSTSSTTTIP